MSKLSKLSIGEKQLRDRRVKALQQKVLEAKRANIRKQTEAAKAALKRGK